MDKFKGFLGKVGEVVKESGGDIAGIALKAATGNIGGAIEDATSLLKGEDSKEAKVLLDELEMRRMEFEVEMKALDVENTKSARDRQVEFLKAGGNDYMMNLAGIVALASFLLAVIVGFFTEMSDSQQKVFFHILGVIEGVCITVRNFYYGSSAGSKQKDVK